MWELLKDFGNWLIDQFWSALVGLVTALLSLIPAPDFSDTAISYIESASSIISYPVWLVGFDVGFPMIIGAMLIRFFIRRLPVVG
jgi:hypothetical protein